MTQHELQDIKAANARVQTALAAFNLAADAWHDLPGPESSQALDAARADYEDATRAAALLMLAVFGV